MGSGLTRIFPALAVVRRRVREAVGRRPPPPVLPPPGSEAVRSFNGQEGRRALFRDLIAAFPFRRVVETGCWLGDTTLWMNQASGLPVATCERDQVHHALAAGRLSGRPGVTLRLAGSRAFLREQAAAPGARGEETLFYLDAHWGKDCPLSEEVAIVAAGWERFVALVDDFRVPGDDGYGYDIYGTLLRPFPLDLPRLRATLARHRLGAWFPTLPSREETGARRGCVVLARADGEWARSLDALPSLRRVP